jgi:hypothetical protein
VKSREGFVACLGAVAVSRYDSKSGRSTGRNTDRSPIRDHPRLASSAPLRLLIVRWVVDKVLTFTATVIGSSGIQSLINAS